MRCAASVTDFVREPIRAYFAGPSFLVWCHDDSLDGTTLWGRPSEADLTSMTRVWASERRVPRIATKDVITDARGLEAIDRAAFDTLLGYLDRERAHLGRRIRRHALLHHKGLTGAMVAGLPRVVTGAEQWRVFTDVDAALGWLGRSDAKRVLAEVSRVVEAMRAAAPLLVALRRHLRQGSATLASSARALAVSPRTLQRALDDEDTTFRQERDRAWIEAARVHLADPTLKLEVIARLSGCTTATSFSKRFRRLAGKTPSAARAEL